MARSLTIRMNPAININPVGLEATTQLGTPAAQIVAGGTNTDNGTTIHTDAPVTGTTLLAENFKGGFGRRAVDSWYSKNYDQAVSSGGLNQTNVANWGGTIFNENGRVLRPNAVVSLPGGKVAGTSGPKDGSGANGSSATTGNMADHDLSSSAESIWGEVYWATSPGYLWGQEKMWTFNGRGVGAGGIDHGDMITNCGAGGTVGNSTGNIRFAHPNLSTCERVNVGDLNFELQSGRWYRVVIHYTLGPNGTFDCWIDDWGPSQSSGNWIRPVDPGTAPTQRFHITGIPRAIANPHTTEWFEMYASDPFTTGERLIYYPRVDTASLLTPTAPV